MKLLNKTIKILLIISFLSSCAAIPANKIKLENYKNFEQKDLEKLDLSYDVVVFEPYNGGIDFNKVLTSKLESKDQKILKTNNVKPTKCIIKVSAMGDTPWARTCIANYFLAGFTLFAIPYYCQHIYEARANLIYYPKDSEVSGIIKPSLNQAKLGEIFLDENNRPAKLLKTYELKDKVHEVWSLIWTLTWFAVDTKLYSNATSPEGATYKTQETISEALTRSIINDAIDHLECYKNSDPKHVLKVQSDVKKYQKNYKEILDRKNQETKEWQNQ